MKQNKNLASSHVNSIWAESDRIHEYLLESTFGMSQAIPIVILWSTDMNSELNQGFHPKRLPKYQIMPHTSGSICTNGATAMLERKSEKFPEPARTLDLLQSHHSVCFLQNARLAWSIPIASWVAYYRPFPHLSAEELLSKRGEVRRPKSHGGVREPGVRTLHPMFLSSPHSPWIPTE